MYVNFTIGVYLSLNGIVYANNSFVFINDIKEYGNGLQCITDRKPCCRNPNEAGEWLFPNGTSVPENVGGLYTSRGPNDGTVILNHFNSAITTPTGRFCCTVPDAKGISQTVCINISKLMIISFSTE